MSYLEYTTIAKDNPPQLIKNLQRHGKKMVLMVNLAKYF